jgi:hypothetical protein
MSSRQEEKERRKAEREALEQAEQKSAARRKRMQMVFGGVLAVAIVAAVVVVLSGVLGGSSGEGQAQTAKGGAAIPAQKQADLKKAAAAAGCKLIDAPNEGANHEDKVFKPSDYKQNPPTSGNHTPKWYQDGEYNPSDTPLLGMLVHPLEHGRIEIQYKPGTPAQTVSQLETLVNESDGGYHMLMFQNATGMPYQVAATAWDHLVGCPTMNPQVFDALRAFKTEFIDKGPEIVP